MATLKTIKKQQGLTNTDVGNELGCSDNKASMILQGRHISVYHDEDIEKLAVVLGITFERCWLSMVESCNESRGTPGATHQRPDEIRAEVQTALKAKMPDVGIDVPRDWTTIESVLVVPEDRRIH